ncbi:Uncharacterised protein [Mycobacteroides abscessus subsp. abscessus]|nr:Uncharacterised protein [Mycobacteroides abscessus subsp. abscessus]
MHALASSVGLSRNTFQKTMMLWSRSLTTSWRAGGFASRTASEPANGSTYRLCSGNSDTIVGARLVFAP